MIRKVALIEPRAPRFHMFSHARLPRLGLPLLGTILRDRGLSVAVYCETVRPIAATDADAIARSDLVGISTTTSTVPRAYALADIMRRKGVRVVLGGVHATFMPDEALEHADYCVRGEAEQTLPALIDALDSGGDLSGVAGLSYRDAGGIHHNPDRRPVENLDSLPTPDLSLIKGFKSRGIVPVLTSRGCPYGCKFCSVTAMFGRRYRFRSTESVLKEIRGHPGSHIFFYDDHFAADRQRTKELLTRMLEEGLCQPWSAQVRTEIARDAEMLDLFEKTNCMMVYVGLESANPEVLAELAKHQSVDDIRECVSQLHKRGIAVYGMFIFGADSDTLASVRETAEFAKETDLEGAQFLSLIPLPGSETFHKLKSEGRIFSEDWELYDGHNVVFEPAGMGPLDLQRETVRAMRAFYSWWEVFKQLWSFDFLRIAVRIRGRMIVGRWRRWSRSAALALAREQIHGFAKAIAEAGGGRRMMMRRNELILVPAALLVVVGAVFLLGSLGVLPYSAAALWPAFPMGMGIGLLAVYFFSRARQRMAQGLVFVGVVFTVVGAACLYSAAMAGWGTWTVIWPIAPLSVGLGLLLMYAAGKRERRILIPAWATVGYSLIAALSTVLGVHVKYLWPPALLLLGAVLLFRHLRRGY